MKDYFISLLNYDRHTNLLMAETIAQAGNPEKAVQLMAHLLAAQQIWLARCKGEPAIGGSIWPDWKVDTFNKINADNSRGWISFLNTLAPADFENKVSYKDTRGNSFQNKLNDILAHLINHGTHHRAQIGQHLKQAGFENLPPTDYIVYIRQLAQNN